MRIRREQTTRLHTQKTSCNKHRPDENAIAKQRRYGGFYQKKDCLLENNLRKNRKKEVNGRHVEPHEENEEFYSKYTGVKKTLTYEEREKLRKKNANKRFKPPYAKKSHWWAPNWNPSKSMETRIGRILAAYGIIFEEPSSIGAALALSDKARNDCAQEWEEMHNATFTALSETNEMNVTFCVPARNILAICDKEEKNAEKDGDKPWSAHFNIVFEENHQNIIEAGSTPIQTTNLEPGYARVEPETRADHEVREEECYAITFTYTPVSQNLNLESSEAVQINGINPNPGINGMNDKVNTRIGMSETKSRNGNRERTRKNLIDNRVPEKTNNETLIIPADCVPSPVFQSLVAIQINPTPEEQTEVEREGFSIQAQVLATKTASTIQTPGENSAGTPTQTTYPETETNISQSAAQPIQNTLNTNPQAQTETNNSSGPIFQFIEFVEEVPIQMVSVLPSDSTLSTVSTAPITSSDIEFVPQTRQLPKNQTTSSLTGTMPELSGAQISIAVEEPISQGNETATSSPNILSQATYGAYSVIADQTQTGRGSISRDGSGKHVGGAYFSSTPGKPNPLRMSTPISPDPEKPENY
ncbi:MAG: hypothetical protein AABW86_06335 [Candidatus Micrarchaeota archaeon]